MELQGKVIEVFPSVGGVSARDGKSWVKNSFLLETFGDYPKKCVFTVFGEDVWSKMGIVKGCSYQVSFDVDAREYNGKWYNDVKAWRAVRIDGSASSPAPAASISPQPSPATRSQSDLPF